VAGHSMHPGWQQMEAPATQLLQSAWWRKASDAELVCCPTPSGCHTVQWMLCNFASTTSRCVSNYRIPLSQEEATPQLTVPQGDYV
jgi:hypothetical protein